MAYFWRLDAKFLRLCDAMYDDYDGKVSHLVCLRVKWSTSFLACGRQMCRSTDGDGSLHKVSILPQNMDSILNKECIGSAGSWLRFAGISPGMWSCVHQRR